MWLFVGALMVGLLIVCNSVQLSISCNAVLKFFYFLVSCFVCFTVVWKPNNFILMDHVFGYLRDALMPLVTRKCLVTDSVRQTAWTWTTSTHGPQNSSTVFLVTNVRLSFRLLCKVCIVRLKLSGRILVIQTSGLTHTSKCSSCSLDRTDYGDKRDQDELDMGDFFAGSYSMQPSWQHFKGLWS